MSTNFENLVVVDDATADILRKMTPAERMEIAFGMWRTVRDTLRADIARQHPELSTEEVNDLAAKTMLQQALDADSAHLKNRTKTS